LAVRSAGLLPYRLRDGRLEVFLVHPGGPFWTRRDEGAWSIAKGEHGDDEDSLDAALREFAEETGFAPSAHRFLDLGEVRQPGGKRVRAWAEAANYDPAAVHSNVFELEWPKGSGRRRQFPEVDRAGWFAIEEARRKLLVGQLPLLERLVAELRRREESPTTAT
jgi:predicted NUDIX family NTP pyrophosphohydrolase